MSLLIEFSLFCSVLLLLLISLYIYFFVLSFVLLFKKLFFLSILILSPKLIFWLVVSYCLLSCSLLLSKSLFNCIFALCEKYKLVTFVFVLYLLNNFSTLLFPRSSESFNKFIFFLNVLFSFIGERHLLSS